MSQPPDPMLTQAIANLQATTAEDLTRGGKREMSERQDLPHRKTGDVSAPVTKERCGVCGFVGPRETFIPHDCYWTLMAIQRRHRVGTAEAMRIQAARYCGPIGGE